DRIHARHAGLEALVHRDAAALVERDARLACAEALHVRAAAYRHQRDVGLFHRSLALRLERDAHAALAALGARRRGLEVEGETLLLERTLELRPHAAVHGGHDRVQELDHRDLGAEPAPDRPQLEPDRARA